MNATSTDYKKDQRPNVMSRRNLLPKLAGAATAATILLKPEKARADVNVEIDNIADLKTYSVSSSINVLVRGYYNPGDGAGGLFFWDTTLSPSSNNGGTIIESSVSTGGMWHRILTGPLFDVKCFGAKGDGVQDDAPFIQTCISTAETWAKSNGGKATVSFPPGEYMLGSFASGGNVILQAGAQSGSPVSLSFVGNEGALLWHNAVSSSTLSTFTGNAEWVALMLYPNLRDVLVEGIEFYADYAASSTAGNSGSPTAIAAFDISGGSSWVLDGLVIRGCRFRNTQFALDSWYPGSGGGSALRLGLQRLAILGNEFLYDNGADSGQIGAANGWVAVRVGGAQGVVVSENIFDGAASGTAGSVKSLEMDGFYFGIGNSDEVISNNVVRHYAFEGIFAINDRSLSDYPGGTYPKGHVISGNVVDSQRAAGVAVTAGLQTGLMSGFATSNISGNIVKNCNCRGISLGATGAASDGEVGGCILNNQVECYGQGTGAEYGITLGLPTSRAAGNSVIYRSLSEGTPISGGIPETGIYVAATNCVVEGNHVEALSKPEFSVGYTYKVVGVMFGCAGPAGVVRNNCLVNLNGALAQTGGWGGDFGWATDNQVIQCDLSCAFFGSGLSATSLVPSYAQPQYMIHRQTLRFTSSGTAGWLQIASGAYSGLCGRLTVSALYQSSSAPTIAVVDVHYNSNINVPDILAAELKQVFFSGDTSGILGKVRLTYDYDGVHLSYLEIYVGNIQAPFYVTFEAASPAVALYATPLPGSATSSPGYSGANTTTVQTVLNLVPGSVGTLAVTQAVALASSISVPNFIGTADPTVSSPSGSAEGSIYQRTGTSASPGNMLYVFTDGVWVVAGTQT